MENWSAALTCSEGAMEISKYWRHKRERRPGRTLFFGVFSTVSEPDYFPGFPPATVTGTEYTLAGRPIPSKEPTEALYRLLTGVLPSIRSQG